LQIVAYPLRAGPRHYDRRLDRERGRNVGAPRQIDGEDTAGARNIANKDVS
jgi:hypothetical protein